MIAEGVATKADGLSIKVKVNEAEMTLTKVTDGLSLARMLLCQLCGLDLSTPIMLADEQKEDLAPTTPETVPSTSTMFMLPVPKYVAWNLPRRFISRK